MVIILTVKGRRIVGTTAGKNWMFFDSIERALLLPNGSLLTTFQTIKSLLRIGNAIKIEIVVLDGIIVLAHPVLHLSQA